MRTTTIRFEKRDCGVPPLERIVGEIVAHTFQRLILERVNLKRLKKEDKNKLPPIIFNKGKSKARVHKVFVK